MSWVSLAAAIASLAATALCADAASGPIGVSQNGRYFVTAKGEPFYFLADTQWELFRRYSIADARMILENRKAKGFTVVMVMLTGVGDGTGPNLDGEHPWLSDNPLRPIQPTSPTWMRLWRWRGPMTFSCSSGFTTRPTATG